MDKVPLSRSRLNIKIDTSNRKLYLFDDDKIIRSYPVGVGKPTTPTPHGSYHIISKIVRPGGILGSRWMGLSVSPTANYGIHGTSNPSSIGGYVSKGCVRMYNRDVEELFSMVSVGTRVEITGNLSYGNAPTSLSSFEDQQTYTIRPGDTLWQLSKTFGVSLQQLIKTNLITDPNKVFPGQKIVIPRS